MKTILPILLVIAAVLLFVVFTKSRFDDAKLLQADRDQIQDTLANARRLRDLRDELVARRGQINAQDLRSLETLLPDHVDNVRLVLDVQKLAAQHGVQIIEIDTQDEEEDGASVLLDDSKPYGTLLIQFAAVSNYGDFVDFLEDLEKSLRLIDIRGIDFNADPESDLYEFEVDMHTYWLKTQ